LTEPAGTWVSNKWFLEARKWVTGKRA